MKKIFIVLIFAVCLTGCGSHEKKVAEKTDGASSKTDQEYISQGMDYLRAGDGTKAIESFDMAIKTNPQKVNNYVVLGEVYTKMGRYDLATDTFSAATHVSPENSEITYLLALNAMLDNRLSKAKQAVQQSIVISLKNKNQEGVQRGAALLKAIEEKEKSSGTPIEPSTQQ